MRRSIFMLTLLTLSLVKLGHAVNITNNIKGVGPQNDPVNPYFCIQNADGQVTYALAPGARVDGNIYSGNPAYVGGTLRFGGCGEGNSYLGYVGLSVNAQGENKVNSYTPPQGVHITLVKPTINRSGVIDGQIQYTAINPNFNLGTPAAVNSPWRYIGFNLSGLEFGRIIDPIVVPNLSEDDAQGQKSDVRDTQAFLNAGMNTVRVPVSWGYLQLEGPGQGEINPQYYQTYVKPLLETLTSARVYTIVDLHAYMRYSPFGKAYSGCGPSGQCPDGTLVLDAKAYEDVWVKLYTLIKNDAKINMNYILFDLVNEPVDVPNDSVFTIQAQVIKGLRGEGYQGPILVEGNSWSGLHSWITGTWTSQDGKTQYSNASLFTRENFAKAGITDLRNIFINVHQYLDSDYSGTKEQCLTNLNTTGPDGFNLNTFVDYLRSNQLQAMVTEFGVGRDSSTCQEALTKFMNYLQDNSAKDKDYGFVGWTIWSTGHGWGDYNLRVTPSSYGMGVLRRYMG